MPRPWLTSFAIFVSCLQISSAVLQFFTPEELRYTFGVTRHEDVPSHEEVFPEVEYDDEGNLKILRVQLGDRMKHLQLESSLDELVGANFAAIHRTKTGGRLSIGEKPADCHYQFKSNHTWAAISNCDGRFKGVIVDEEGIHVIHPFPDRHGHRSKRATGTEHGVHIVYKREALAPKDDFCGLDQEITEEQLIDDESSIYEDVYVTGKQLVAQGDLVVELAVFVDETLWRHFNSKYGGQASQKLQDYTLTLLNNIQIMYYQPTAVPPLTFRIIRYEVLAYQPSALAANLHQNGHAQQYLDRFCRYQRNLGVRDWDHAFMLTGFDIHRGYGSRSISGIARLDGMCDPWNTCTLAEGLDFTSAFIGTHELGHSVGMRHDEPYCPSKHIMSSSLGSGKVTWSTCSLRDYHQFLQRLDSRGKNCLRVSNQPVKMPLPTNSKPGQLYDANQQCQLMHGVGYQQVTPRSDHYDGICYMMWCGQSTFGRILSSHPALEGTFCGPSKWCSLGRCIPWTGSQPIAPAQGLPPPPTPQVVHGGWSGWSATNCDACICSPLNDGIGLAVSRRTCNNPAPQNGGSECVGSDSRALICNRDCAVGRTVDQYISEKCAEHRRLKNDGELTGTGQQLTRFPQRACKVFCDVVNRYGTQRNYRFFGDNLPDGTACGPDRYCLNGECLALTCSGNSALIGRDQSCPSESCPVRARPNNYGGSWGTWSLWSSCSVTCGGGYRKRMRVCPQPGTCFGNEQDEEQCNTYGCPAAAPTSYGPHWTEWTDWNQCSVSCGRGSQARYRRCVNDDNSLATTCPGPFSGVARGVRRTLYKDKNIEVRSCDLVSCDGIGIWSDWGIFSSCSTSCGPGIMVRQRVCRREPCDGSAHERQSCNVRECSGAVFAANGWGEWGAWSQCSHMCGRGLRTRSRTCSNGLNACPGIGHEQEFCNTRPCDGSPVSASGEWSAWGGWSSCSATCGAGVMRRTRYCQSGNCPGNYKESAICNDQDCGNRDAFWGGWGYWSTCSETCGQGTRKRVRKCYGSGQCGGNEFERETCYIRAC